MTVKRLANGRYQVRWRDREGCQRAENFRTKEQAQAKQRSLDRGETAKALSEEDRPTLGAIVANWQAARYPGMGAGTRVRYDTILRLYFQDLLPLSIDELTPRRLDDWVEWLKADLNRYGKGMIRTTFRYELATLRAILSFYEDYVDDPDFRMPLKRRHLAASRLKRRPQPRPRDLSEIDFRAFRTLLERD